MEKLPYIMYNSSNNDRSKENRKNMTNAEAKIWYKYLKYRPMWYKFTRQKPIDSFILDFYCAKLLLWIEIDWTSHDNKSNYDNMRTIKIWKLWIKIIRYTNTDVICDFFWVKENILCEINIRQGEIKNFI